MNRPTIRSARAAPALFAAGLFAVGCGEAPLPDRCGPSDLAPLVGAPAFAVLTSDYAASAIALLDDEASVITQSWIDSGTVQPNLVQAMSGDVTLPTVGPACELAYLDRFQTNALTRLPTCDGDGRVTQLDLGEAFAANPQDVLVLADGSRLISRYEQNPRDPSGPDGGNDVVRVDDDGRSMARYPMAPLDAVTEDGDVILARPRRMVALSDRVVVGLDRLSMSWEAGPGLVAVLEPATGALRGLPLDGLVNCGEVDPYGEATFVGAIVTCRGAPFADEDGRRAGAGFALIGGDDVSVVEVWRAAEHPDAPVPSAGTLSLGDGTVLTVAEGDLLANVPDRLVRLRLDESATSTLVEAAPFTLGQSAQLNDGTVLLPDAEAFLVRRLRMDQMRELDPIDVSGCTGLPPREVRPLGP